MTEDERVGDVQFGVNIRSALPAAEFAAAAAAVETAGYDVLAAADHLGGPSPFSLLAAAAMVTRRVRLRTSVLNVGFWNPALLARELATVDVLSDGRVELGIGAGHAKAEHDSAGLPWPRHADRVAALRACLVGVRERLADPEHRPVPVQQPIPVMVGAMSPSGLGVAAEYADVVGFAGLQQRRGAAPGTFDLASPADTDARVAQVRAAAAGRPYRSEVLLQWVQVEVDPEAAAAELTTDLPGTTVADLLASPWLLLAPTPQDAVRELENRRDRYGFDSFATHWRSEAELAQVIAAGPGRARPGDGESHPDQRDSTAS